MIRLRPEAGRLLLSPMVAAIAFASIVLPPGAAPAQDATGSTPTTAREVEKIERERELDILRDDFERARKAEADLKVEVDAIKEDRARLGRSLIETAARVRTIENTLNAIGARLVPLDTRESEIRASLESRRETLTAVLAAMTRLARRPTPALILRPDEVLESVRTAMLLGAVVPELHGEAEALVADLTELGRVRREIATERDALANQRAELEEERRRLNALVNKRQRQQAAREKDLTSERARTAALARQVATVGELVTRIEREIESAARAAETARRQAQSRTSLAALSDPARIEPATPFAEARGRLPLPAAGTIVREFGRNNEQGRAEPGIWIETRIASSVIAPCDGWVVYAGQFRSYGRLLIINAGGGYHVLLAGMDEITVELGQFVLTGEPVAVMGSGSGTEINSAESTSQPMLYIEFRRDGKSIDPGPWWADMQSEKARG
jgi:septal ring factor EnvC (AmiA/AmiB activator)